MAHILFGIHLIVKDGPCFNKEEHTGKSSFSATISLRKKVKYRVINTQMFPNIPKGNRVKINSYSNYTKIA